MAQEMTKEEFLEKYLSPYQQIAEKALPALNLKVQVAPILSKLFYFDMQAEKNKIDVYCELYDAGGGAAFLHYLCHAKLHEEGWLSPRISHKLADCAFEMNKIKQEGWLAKSEDEKERIYFTWINRTADSFVDFFVWNLVEKLFGKKYFLDFSNEICNSKPEEIIAYMERRISKNGFAYSNYAFCLDWFAMFYIFSKDKFPEVHEKLDNLWNSLEKKEEFRKLVPGNSLEKIKWARKFYTKLSEKYSDYKGILHDTEAFKNSFREYYNNVWIETGVNVDIIDFVRTEFKR